MRVTLLLVALLAGGTASWAMSPPAVAPLIPKVKNAQVTLAIGVWRLIYPKSTGKQRVPSPGTECFLYDGKYVTLRLFTEKDWMWKRADDHYRVAMKWTGNKLYYRPPFGRFQYLATFDAKGRRFTLRSGKWSYVYQLVQEVPSLRPAERILLDPRPAHDYRIKPTDPR